MPKPYTGNVPICPQGHDKRIVGVRGTTCAKCHTDYTNRLRKREGYKHKPYTGDNPICTNGHDKRVEGVFGTGCAACARERSSAADKARRRKNPTRFSRLAAVDLSEEGRLRRQRERLGLSIRAFARIANLKHTHLYYIETGKRRATPQTQRKIVEAIAKVQRHRRKFGMEVEL